MAWVTISESNRTDPQLQHTGTIRLHSYYREGSEILYLVRKAEEQAGMERRMAGKRPGLGVEFGGESMDDKEGDEQVQDDVVWIEESRNDIIETTSESTWSSNLFIIVD